LPPVLHALITFAAAEEGEEASKTLFYIAGGALVAFAIVVSAIGITRSSFPTSKGASRGVMALAALLVACTMAAAVITG
jgi:hypothetical protein